MTELLCGRCLKPRDLGTSQYLVVPGLHACAACALEWKLRQEMAALGWMQGAARPETTPREKPGEQVGGTD